MATIAEDASNAKTKDCCDWINTHNRLPKNTSSDPTEKAFGTWLNNRKSIKRKTINGVWYDSDVDVATKNGHPHLFDRIRCRSVDQRTEKAHKINEWISKHSMMPRLHSTDTEERKMATWISSRKNNIKRGVEQVDVKILASVGVDISMPSPRIAQLIERTTALCNWIKESKRLPWNNAEEKKLFGTWRRLVKNTSNEEMEILKSMGMVWILTNTPISKNEMKSNKIAEWVGKYYESHGAIPTMSVDKELATWIARKHRANRNLPGAGVVYDSDIKILNKYGIGNAKAGDIFSIK